MSPRLRAVHFDVDPSGPAQRRAACGAPLWVQRRREVRHKLSTEGGGVSGTDALFHESRIEGDELVVVYPGHSAATASAYPGDVTCTRCLGLWELRQLLDALHRCESDEGVVCWEHVDGTLYLDAGEWPEGVADVPVRFCPVCGYRSKLDEAGS